MPILEQIKQFQTGSITVTSATSTVLNVAPQSLTSKLPNKLTDTISQLTSKTNEISSFLNDASINGGNGPFSLSKFAREFVTKQNTSDEGQTSQVTNSKPITRKSKQITQKVVNSISQNYIKSRKLLVILEKQLNKVLAQNKVTYVKVENGQIIAQPIQNKEITKAVENIQQTVDTYVNTVDKYARRVYNTDPIMSVKQLQQNLSLNHIVDFVSTVIAIQLLILQIRIKIRKAQDTAAAANALLTVPPQPLVAARFAQMALENTAFEQKQLDDLAESQEWITEIKKKVDFYGKKYTKAKNQLLDIQGTIAVYQTQLINKTLNQVENQLTGSINQLTGSLDTKINSITGSK